jgi:hypothetical protein
MENRTIELVPVLASVFTLAVAMTGCGTLEVPSAGEGGESRVAVVERYPDEPFRSGIKYFEHSELGFRKRSAGDATNCAYCWRRVVTPPGAVRVGLVGAVDKTVAVAFQAETGGHYYATVTCPVDSPCPVAIDAATNLIVATAEAEQCKDLVGTRLDRCNECWWHGGPARRFRESWSLARC